jgi:hypothetical protein
MDYTISRMDMLHESGTKFYSIYGITVDRRAVCIGNWGKRKIESFGRHDIREVSGSFIVETGPVHAMEKAAEDLINKKKNRGYIVVAPTKSTAFPSMAKLIANIRLMFGKHAEEIIEFLQEGESLRGLVGAEPTMIIMDELTNIEDLAVPKVESVCPSEWGSW